jgi:Tfp pilus assembly protein PilF
LYAQSEESFLRALKLPEGRTTFSLYLRLGYLYLKSLQFGNARAFFTKATIIKNNSSLAWLGLGIACNKSKMYADAELALS